MKIRICTYSLQWILIEFPLFLSSRLGGSGSKQRDLTQAHKDAQVQWRRWTRRCRDGGMCAMAEVWKASNRESSQKRNVKGVKLLGFSQVRKGADTLKVCMGKW